MQTDVYLVTVVKDDAGNVLVESRVPFAPSSPQNASSQNASSQNASSPAPKQVSSLHWAEDDEEEDGEEAIRGEAQAVTVLPAPAAPNALPIESLIDTDPAVLEMFGKDAQVYRTQTVQPAVGEDGTVEIRSQRRGGGPVSAAQKPVEMTAARARAVGMNIPAGGENRIISGGMEDQMSRFMDTDDAAVAA